MMLEDVDRLAKLATEYKNLASMEAALRRDWKCQRLTIKIEWQASGKSEDFYDMEMSASLREQFAEGVKVVRERIQTHLALLGVDKFPEIK